MAKQLMTSGPLFSRGSYVHLLKDNRLYASREGKFAELLNQKTDSALKKTLTGKEEYLKQLNNIFGKGIVEDMYYLLDDFRNGITDEMVMAIEDGLEEVLNSIRGISSNDMSNPKALPNILDNLKKVLTYFQIEKIDDAINQFSFLNSLIDGNNIRTYQKNKTETRNYNPYQLIAQKKTTIEINVDNLKGKEKFLLNLQSSYKALQELNHLAKSKNGNFNTVHSKVMKTVLNSLKGATYSYFGLLTEDFTQQQIQKLIERIFNNLYQGKYIGKDGTTIDIVRKSSQKINDITYKSDLSLVKKVPSIEDPTAMIEIPLPGISVKTHYIDPEYAKNAVYLHITLENKLVSTALAEISRQLGGNMFDKLQTAYYNSQIGLNFPYRRENQNALAKANFIFALAGQLTKEDTVFFFKVNNRWFTVPQILKSVDRHLSSFEAAFKPTYYSLNINKKIGPKENDIESALKRSEKVLKEIKQQKITTKLLLDKALMGY